MKAILLKRTGGPGVLKLRQVPDPAPGPGEVLVEIYYSGVNYAEILSRRGLYGWAVKRPYILGMEASGVISRVGEGVAPERVGQQVMVGAQYGCYAEKIVIAADQAVPAIAGFTLAESAAFLVNFMTAWVSLFPMGRLAEGEKVLITAAAGGVGTAAVQLASRAGATVFAMAGNPEKIALVKQLGAKEGINYRVDDWAKQLEEEAGRVDLVLEMVGGQVFRECLKLLNPFGRMVVAGFASLDLQKWNPFSWIRTLRDIPRVGLQRMARQSIALMATHLGYLLNDPQRTEKIFTELSVFVQEHHLKPVISKVFPIQEAGAAHAYIESRQSFGKVLLKHHIAASDDHTSSLWKTTL